MNLSFADVNGDMACRKTTSWEVPSWFVGIEGPADGDLPFTHVHRPIPPAALGRRNQRLGQVTGIAKPAPARRPAMFSLPHRAPICESQRSTANHIRFFNNFPERL
jgi:hypothetical protein